MPKRAQLTITTEVRFVTVPKEEMGAWRAGLHLLLQLIRKVKIERDLQDQLMSESHRAYHWIGRMIPAYQQEA